MGSNTAGPSILATPYLPALLHKYENDAPECVGYKPDVEILNIDLNSIFN
jgi:hypothetical protein